MEESMSDEPQDELESFTQALHDFADKMQAAVDAEAIKTGVTQDPNYETLSTRLHGLGQGDLAEWDVRLRPPTRPNLMCPACVAAKAKACTHRIFAGDEADETEVGDLSAKRTTDLNVDQRYTGTPDAAITANDADLSDEREEPVERLINQRPGGNPQHNVNAEGKSVPTGGGGGSGRKRGRKEGTLPTCDICHLQNCHCVDSDQVQTHKGRGRRRRYEDERLEAYRVHVRTSDVLIIQQAGLTFSRVVEAEVRRLAQAIQNQQSWDETQEGPAA